MPQTVLGWGEDADRSATEAGLAALLADNQLYVNGDQIQWPAGYKKVAFASCGSDHLYGEITEVRLNSPNLNGRGVANWRMHKGWAGGGDDDVCYLYDTNLIYDYHDVPFTPDNGNGIEGQMVTAYANQTDLATTAQSISCMVHVTTGRLPIYQRNITHHVLFTLGATTTAFTWDQDTPALTDDIPAGNYLIHGFDFVSCTALGARLMIPKIGFRPATIPRRITSAPQHPFCKSFYPNGIGYEHKGGTIDLRVEYVTEVAETPDDCTLYLQYMGPHSGQ